MSNSSPHRAKTISIKQLHGAVATALGAASRIHPGVPVPPTENLIHIPYWICGIPVPWPLETLGEPQLKFAATFAEHLSQNPAIAGLGEAGAVQAAVYSTGGQSFAGVTGVGAVLGE